MSSTIIKLNNGFCSWKKMRLCLFLFQNFVGNLCISMAIIFIMIHILCRVLFFDVRHINLVN